MATHETFFTEFGKKTYNPNSKPNKKALLGGEPAPKLVPWLKNLKIHLNYLQILQMSPAHNLVPLTRLNQGLWIQI